MDGFNLSLIDDTVCGFSTQHELQVIVAGATMYWRAAMEVSAKAGGNGKLASLSAAMIAAFGLLVLFLDYTS